MIVSLISSRSTRSGRLGASTAAAVWLALAPTVPGGAQTLTRATLKWTFCAAVENGFTRSPCWRVRSPAWALKVKRFGRLEVDNQIRRHDPQLAGLAPLRIRPVYTPAWRNASA